MTVSTVYAPVNYNGNGVTTVFAVPFVFWGNTDLVVTKTVITTGVKTILTLSDYMVSGGDGATGSITIISAPATGERITIEISLPGTQTSDFVENQAFPAEVLEEALDKVTVLAQQAQSTAERSLVFPASDTSPSTELPIASLRASKLLSFDASGNPTSFSVSDLPIAADDLVTSSLAGGDFIVWDNSAGNWTNKDSDPFVMNNLQAGTSAGLILKNSVGTQVADFGPANTTNVSIAGGLVLGTALTVPNGGTGLTALEATVASASTVDLGAQVAPLVNITGTTTITSFGTVAAGTLRRVVFSGALTLTHNGTSLILPGSANITTAAGDSLVAVSLGSGNWRVVDYTKAAVIPGNIFYESTQASTSGTSIDFTSIPVGVTRIVVSWQQLSSNGTNHYLIQLGDSGGVETTGYLGASSSFGSNFSNGIVIFSALAANSHHGSATFLLHSSNLWVCTGISGLSSSASSYYFAGSKTLSDTLDRIRVTTNGGTDTFDGGSITVKGYYF